MWLPCTSRHQVELLLTFEEYCCEEGVFEEQGENGKAFADIFEPVRMALCAFYCHFSSILYHYVIH